MAVEAGRLDKGSDIMGFQFGNRFAELKVFDAEVDGYVSGSTGAVSEEFSDIVRGTFAVGDLGALLAELLEGDGVEGVELARITGSSVTLGFANRGLIDTAVFEGVGDVLQGLSDKFQFGNRFAQFAVFDVERDGYVSGSTGAVSGEFRDIVRGTFTTGDLDALLAEVIEGDGVEGVELVGLGADSVALAFSNRGLVDTAVFTGAGGLLAELADDFQFGNRFAQLAVVDASTDDYISGSTNKVSDELNDIVGGTFRAGAVERLLEEVVRGDGVENVRLTDFSEGDDTATLAFDNAGRTDTIVFTNVDFDFG